MPPLGLRGRKHPDLTRRELVMSEPLRVILTCNYSPWSRYSGGGQRSTHALGTALVSLGHDVTVIFTKVPGERLGVPDRLPYRLRWSALAGLRSDGKNPLRFLNMLPMARSVAQELNRPSVGRASIVNAQGEESAWFAQSLRARRPSGVRFVQTPRYPRFPDPLRGALGGRIWLRPKFATLGYALRRACRVCPTSTPTADALARLFGVPRSRLEVIPNGLDEGFLTAKRAPTAATGPLVFFGRLSKSKGIVDLIDAWLDLDERIPLVIGGTGPERPVLEARIAERGRRSDVQWLGWCDAATMAETLAGARAAVLPSHEESFGNTMVEAMAAGTPLITTDAGSIPEVTGGERHVTLVPAENASKLREAMGRDLARPEELEARAAIARDFARAQYSWVKTARRYEDVYHHCLAEPPR
ncbi:MAG: glycosyltransferase family 4 protein [Myxococcota bacterium]